MCGAQTIAGSWAWVCPLGLKVRSASRDAVEHVTSAGAPERERWWLKLPCQLADLSLPKSNRWLNRMAASIFQQLSAPCIVQVRDVPAVFGLLVCLHQLTRTCRTSGRSVHITAHVHGSICLRVSLVLLLLHELSRLAQTARTAGAGGSAALDP